jgi:hypothetical protein
MGGILELKESALQTAEFDMQYHLSAAERAVEHMQDDLDKIEIIDARVRTTLVNAKKHHDLAQAARILIRELRG